MPAPAPVGAGAARVHPSDGLGETMAANRRLTDSMRAILRALHEGGVIEMGGDQRQRLNGAVLRKQTLDAMVDRGVLERRLGVYTATPAGTRIGRAESQRAALSAEGFAAWLEELRAPAERPEGTQRQVPCSTD